MNKVLSLALLSASLMIVSSSASARVITNAPALSVHLSYGTNPVTLLKGSQRVPLVNVVMQSGCERNVRIASITFRHRGLGDASDIERMYILDGIQRISPGSSFSEQGSKATVRLRSFVVPACATRTVTVAADMSPDAATGGEHAVTIDHERDIDADVESLTLSQDGLPVVVRTSPLQGGELAIEYPSMGTSVIRYGANRRVGRLLFHNAGDRTLRIHSVTITNQGKASFGDLQRLYLEASNGKRLTPIVDAMEDNKIHVLFDPPVLLSRNQRLLMNVKADVRSGIRKTIQLEIEEPSDVGVETLLRTRTGSAAEE